MKRIKKITITALLIGALSLTIAGCAQKPAAEGDTQIAKKIVVLSPADMEILFAIGAGDSVVGRSNYCDYPTEALKVESVGECLLPNTEKIVALKPDVVISEPGLTDQDTLDGLKKLGIRVDANMPPNSLDGIYDKIIYLGALSGKTKEAEKLVSDLKDFVAKSLKENQGSTPKKVYYVIDTGEYGEFTATGDTFISNIIETAGFENVAKAGTGWMFSPELLIAANPDFIIGSELNISKIKANAQYKNIKAVTDNKLIVIDDNIFSRPSPRAISEGVTILKERLK